MLNKPPELQIIRSLDLSLVDHKTIASIIWQCHFASTLWYYMHQNRRFSVIAQFCKALNLSAECSTNHHVASTSRL